MRSPSPFAERYYIGAFITLPLPLRVSLSKWKKLFGSKYTHTLARAILFSPIRQVVPLRARYSVPFRSQTKLQHRRWSCSSLCPRNLPFAVPRSTYRFRRAEAFTRVARWVHWAWPPVADLDGSRGIFERRHQYQFAPETVGWTRVSEASGTRLN